MVAFILTACHRLWFSGLFREGLTAALGTPSATVRHPCRVWGLIWCPTTQDKISVAPLTPCSISLELLYSSNPALPNIWQSRRKYFLLKWSRENQYIPLCLSLINLFWYPYCHCRKILCHPYLSSLLALPVRRNALCFKGIFCQYCCTVFWRPLCHRWWWWWCSQRIKNPAMKAQRAGGADSISSKAFLVSRSERKSFHLEEDIRVEVRDGDFRRWLSISMQKL